MVAYGHIIPKLSVNIKNVQIALITGLGTRIIKSKRKEEIKVNNMFEEMGKANIRAFCDKLEDKVLNHTPDVIAECPLLETTTVINIIRELRKEMAE